MNISHSQEGTYPTAVAFLQHAVSGNSLRAIRVQPFLLKDVASVAMVMVHMCLHAVAA